jgi:hypothetical protein
MVVPSLSTLLSDPVGNKLGDKGPLFRSVLTNSFQEQFVLLISPLSFPKHEIILKGSIFIASILVD